MRFYVTILLFLGSVFFVSCAQKTKNIPRSIASLSKNDQLEGTWFLQGTSDMRGAYNGEIEFRKGTNGTYAVTRIATYINSFYEGLKVQEVWTGEAVADSDSIVVVYHLKSADFITRLNNNKRQVSDFRSPKEVVARFVVRSEGLKTEFSDKKFSHYNEWISTQRPLDTLPLWTENKKTVSIRSDRMIASDLELLKKQQKQIGYTSDPLAKSLLKRATQPKLIIDQSDYDFYKKHKDILRVVNKITDDIAVAEAVQKRNSFAPSLLEKATGFDNKAQKFHLNKYGIISNAILDSKDNFKASVYSPDSAFLTGQYLASQNLRHSVTKDKAVLENIRKSLSGISVLFSVTGQENKMARTLASYNPNVEINPDWFAGQVGQDPMLWKEGSDIISLRGVLNGLLWTTRQQGLNSAEGQAAQDLIRKFMTSKKIGLNAEDRSLLEYFYGFQQDDSAVIKVTPRSKDIWYYSGVAPWSTLHAYTLHYQNMILVAEIKQSDSLKGHAAEELKYLSQKFNHPRVGDLSLSYSLAAKAQNQQIQENVLWSLKEIPYPKPNLNVTIDHSYNSDWELSPVPKNYKQKNGAIESVDFYYQGLTSYPLYETIAYTENPLLQSPFTYSVTQAQGVETNGVDYLYAYWLGRYTSVISENE